MNPVVGSFLSIPRDRLSSVPSDIEFLEVQEEVSEGSEPATVFVKVLWRQQFEEFRFAIDRSVDRAVNEKKATVFTGPAGAGKSCMLYALIHYAASKNCIVLYIPTSGELVSRDDVICAKFILNKLREDNPTWNKWFPEISLVTDGVSDEDLIQRAKRAVQEIMICTRVSCAVAIDQWNVVRDAPRGSLFEQLFGTFDQTRVARGVTYLAVSSSFVWPLGLFRDADMLTHRFTVALYSPEELSVIADRMRTLNQLPPLGSGFDNEQISAICGPVGRMLAVAHQVWEQLRSDRWSKNHTKKFNDLAGGYYTRRVQSLLLRATEDSVSKEERRSLTKYVAGLFLNKVSSEDTMPNQFEWAGLYDSTTFKPVCPAVILGIERALLDPSSELLRFLAEHEGTIGTALELFVERGMRKKCPKDLVVSCTDLTGKVASSLSWKISFVARQSRDDPTAALNNIADGTLIICCPGHAVVDMVLYSGGIVYFIQISMLPYNSHSTKVENLIDARVPSSTETVGAFYMSRAPESWRVPSMGNTFRKNVTDKMKYVYITPDSTSHRIEDRSPARFVLRIGGENLSALGNEFRMFCKESSTPSAAAA